MTRKNPPSRPDEEQARRPILLTAFEPFGGEAINPAQEALRLLPGSVPGRSLVKLLLPTAFEPAAEQLKQAIDRLQPAEVVMLGQAGGRAGITVERVAINLDDADIPDNLGHHPKDLPIAPDGPAAYFATLPVKKLVRAINAAGCPASLSCTAGTYVCNHVFYTALHHLSKTGQNARAGFIHLPFLPEQAQGREPLPPSLALERQTAGLLALLQALGGAAPGGRTPFGLRLRHTGKGRYTCR